MSLVTPSKIRELQKKLYVKAKQEPSYRFYLLYDKIYREDILAHATALSKAKAGAPGVDGSGDGEDRTDPERGEDVRSGRQARAVPLSGLYVRATTLLENGPVV